MYGIFIALLLIGIIMVIDGTYREEIERLKRSKVVEYKYIPRSTYDDLFYGSSYQSTFDTVFSDKVDSRAAGRYI